MTGGSNALAVIPQDVLLDDYYTNLHGAYNSMRECFTVSGMTQDQIAGALGVDKALVSRRLNGSENLTLKTLSYMGSAMGCRIMLNFVPYSMVGIGNSYPKTSSASFNVTSTGADTPVFSGNAVKLLENT